MNCGRILFKTLMVIFSIALVVPSDQAEGGVIIDGVNYSPTATTESLTSLFTNSSGTLSTNTYFGFVEIEVSGTGASFAHFLNDAFYVFDLGYNDPQNYQLVVTKGGDVVNGQFGDDLAIKNIVFDVGTGLQVTPGYVPAYRPDHTYKFVLDTTRLPGGDSQLRFGVNDGSYGDNSGQYNITVTQLAPASIASVPEPASVAIFGLGAIGLLFGGRRHRTHRSTNQ